MRETLKEFNGCYHVTPKTNPDHTIRFETSTIPCSSQIIDIVSIHGQNKRVMKSIGLSLKDVVELKNILQEVIDNSPTTLAKK